MRKSLLILISITLLLVIGTVSALAEPSLTDILNDKFGSGTYHEITSTNEYKFSPQLNTITILKDHQAGYTNPTGWYVAGNTNAKTQLYANPADNLSNNDVIRTIQTSGMFGLYIQSGNGNTYFSESSLNPDVTDPDHKGKHVKCFMIDSGVEKGAYVLGFEDLESTGSDWDYQDLVVELKGANLSVPEFPTISLPVAAVLGILFVVGRKKEGI